jgi:hypothetical protein
MMMQVLSESVSCALAHTGGDKTSETQKFTSMFDKFFDMLNVGSFTRGMKQRKRFQYPYRHVDDFRLDVSATGHGLFSFTHHTDYSGCRTLSSLI